MLVRTLINRLLEDSRNYECELEQTTLQVASNEGCTAKQLMLAWAFGPAYVHRWEGIRWLTVSDRQTNLGRQGQQALVFDPIVAFRGGRLRRGHLSRVRHVRLIKSKSRL